MKRLPLLLVAVSGCAILAPRKSATYEETVAWLDSHSRTSAYATVDIRGIPTTVRARLAAGKARCELLLGEEIRQSEGAARRMFRVDLKSLSLPTIDAKGPYLVMKGKPDLSTPITIDEDGTETNAGLSEGSLVVGWTSHDDADRAANAVFHLAKLCGAQDIVDPF